ncbi:unnamed protein product [Caenorhabditis auriculariae]|uniref:BPTI/Kunitz inhibitor domain-containing protein n=1 Tax=Caenorhabditis auriculariae TaxID=2777116 RepID=A0A8S1HH03_9PELO|nr:unnamed protein product [Caenorhabditis auriculariae]
MSKPLLSLPPPLQQQRHPKRPQPLPQRLLQQPRMNLLLKKPNRKKKKQVKLLSNLRESREINHPPPLQLLREQNANVVVCMLRPRRFAVLSFQPARQLEILKEFSVNQTSSNVSALTVTASSCPTVALTMANDLTALVSIQSAPRSTVKECVGEASRGPCQSTLNRCLFDYSGCGGNGNNYESKESCESRCAPPPRGLPKCEIGEPLKTKIGVPVNCAKTDCPSGYKCNIVQQSSVCCQESSKDVGLQTVDDRCKLPKERGPCDKYELRFYYNPDLHECKYFFWGGCDGNTNNFEKAEDCEVACGVRKQGVSKTVEEHPGRGQQHVGFRTTQGIRITPHMLTTTPSTDNASTTASPEEATSTTVKEERRPTTTTTRRTSPTTTTSTTTAKTTTSAPRTTTRTRPSVPLPSRPRTAPVVAEDSEEEAQDVRVVVPNQVLIGGTEAPDSVNRCKHPKDSGNCRGQFVRWYFDDATQLCDVFTYTGCQGNGNNFASREECQAICAKPPSTAAPLPDFSNICNNDVDAGECNGVFQRFAFDTEAGDCRPFTYGGCGGNGNNFATIAECRQRCTKTPEVPPNACDTDIEVGECSGVFHRFAFDKNINDCRQFTYGGCGGNGNNFASMQECRNKCVNRICPEPPACDLLRCQLVNDRSGCPFCSCPPVRQPSPPASTACQPVQNCADPCIVISNRKGCEECVCPSPEVDNGVVPPSPLPTVHLPPPTQTTRVARPPATHVARPPASFEDVGPPSRPIAPPAATNAPPRQHAVPTVESFEEKPIELPVRPSLPNLPTLLSAQLEEKCMQAVEPGPCKNFADRWYFNSEDGTCHPFKYGGCAGNRNHFFTQKECEVHCARFLSQFFLFTMHARTAQVPVPKVLSLISFEVVNAL